MIFSQGFLCQITESWKGGCNSNVGREWQGERGGGRTGIGEYGISGAPTIHDMFVEYPDNT